MRIPKTFLPEKDLEEKTNSLLKERENKEDCFADKEIDKEAEQLFPNFINYVKNKCGPLHIDKIYDDKKKTWFVYQIYRPGNYFHIGIITSYVEPEGMDMMYGYKANIAIKGKKLSLMYRVGYQCCDHQGRIVFSKNPARYDIEEVPFP